LLSHSRKILRTCHANWYQGISHPRRKNMVLWFKACVTKCWKIQRWWPR
jgi:hypothetical protein